jgi:LPS export ABC transporter permease LptG
MIVTWYIVRYFLKYFVIFSLITVFLFIALDFTRHISATHYFSIHNYSAMDVCRYYITQVPFVLLQVAPLACLLSSFLSMLTMACNYEMVALRSFGFSLKQCLRVLLLCGFCIFLFELFVIEAIIPVTSRSFVNLKARKENLNYKFKSHEKLLYVGNYFVHFGKFDFIYKKFINVTIAKLNSENKLKKIIFAKSAFYNGKEKKWEMSHARVFDVGVNILKSYNSYIKYSYSIPFDIEYIKSDFRSSEELSILELYRQIKIYAAIGRKVKEYEIMYYTRISNLISLVTMSLTGIGCAYIYRRNINMINSILQALFLGGIFLTLQIIGNSMSSANYISSWFGVWLGNIFIFSWFLSMFFKLKDNFLEAKFKA